MSNLVISESWSSCYLFPKTPDFPIGNEVRASMIRASDFAESDHIVESHLFSTAFAAESFALSLLMTFGYIGKGIYDFFAIMIEKGFLESLQSLGQNLLSSLQSLALSVIGVLSFVAGIFYPKTYSLLAPTEETILRPIKLQDQESQTEESRDSTPTETFASREREQTYTPPFSPNKDYQDPFPKSPELILLSEKLQRAATVENNVSTPARQVASDLLATFIDPSSDEVRHLVEISERLQRAATVENNVSTPARQVVSDPLATFIDPTSDEVRHLVEISERLQRAATVENNVSTPARQVVSDPLTTFIDPTSDEVRHLVEISERLQRAATVENNVSTPARQVVSDPLATFIDPTSDEVRHLVEISERLQRASILERSGMSASSVEEDLFDVLDADELDDMSATTDVEIDQFDPEGLIDMMREESPLLRDPVQHEILSLVKTFPLIFEERVFQRALGKLFSMRAPLEDRSTLIFQDRSLIPLLNRLNEEISQKDRKEGLFIQEIVTDLILFTAFVPSRLERGQYESIEPFTAKNIALFLNHLIEGKDLGSTLFFNAYFEKAQTAAQKILFLSSLHLRFDIQQKVLEDPLFEMLLAHPNLEEIMLKTSGHLIQTSLYSCVGAAYNMQVLHKTPNIIALIYFIRYVLARTEKKLSQMSEEEKNAIAFENYHLTKEAHVLETRGKVETGLQEMYKSLEKALKESPFSKDHFTELTKMWNHLNQQALSVLDPKHPVWFAALPIHGHYRTSYTLNFLGHLLSPWGPSFHERRSNGQFRRDLLDKIPVLDGLDGSTFDYDLSRYTTFDAKLEELQLRFENLIRQGSMILLFQIAQNTKHANIIRAFYQGNEPRFLLLDPMKPNPYIMTMEEMVRFSDTHKMF